MSNSIKCVTGSSDPRYIHQTAANTGFDEFFEGKSWPEAKERVGVMSVDSLNRQWELVSEEQGYLIAKSSDGYTALLGPMCKRNDDKFCIEIVVRATIYNNTLRHFEFWHVDLADKLRHAQWLNHVMRVHLVRSKMER